MKDKRVDKLIETMEPLIKAVEHTHHRLDLCELTIIELLKRFKVATRVYKRGEEIVRVELVDL